MNYLHSLQPPVIHSDLKIQNVLVSDTFEAKVSHCYSMVYRILFYITRWMMLEHTTHLRLAGNSLCLMWVIFYLTKFSAVQRLVATNGQSPQNTNLQINNMPSFNEWLTWSPGGVCGRHRRQLSSSRLLGAARWRPCVFVGSTSCMEPSAVHRHWS